MFLFYFRMLRSHVRKLAFTVLEFHWQREDNQPVMHKNVLWARLLRWSTPWRHAGKHHLLHANGSLTIFVLRCSWIWKIFRDCFHWIVRILMGDMKNHQRLPIIECLVTIKSAYQTKNGSENIHEIYVISRGWFLWHCPVDCAIISLISAPLQF